MIDFVPDSTAAILRHQLNLPDEIRQSCVLVVFSEAVNANLLQEFMQIQLTPLMMSKGEEGFYMANRIQPQRLGEKRCPKCKQTMHPLSLNEFRCNNRMCSVSASDGFVGGPRSGVLGIRIAPEFVTRTEMTEFGPIDFVDRCVIVLDRRYEPDTLAGVLRTAHWIAEERGWKLK